MIDKEDKEYIEIARKYRLRLGVGIIKLEAFRLFDKGHSASEVRFILHQYEIEPGTNTFASTIGRYHLEWQRRQPKKLP